MRILGPRQRGIPAPFALPAGFAAFLAVGTVAAALHGRLDATGVLIACAAVAGAMSFAAEPVASVLLAGIGWLTVVGFSRPPYAQLRPTGTAAGHAAIVIGATSLACAALGLVFRWYVRRLTLVSMGTYMGMRARRSAAQGAPRHVIQRRPAAPQRGPEPEGGAIDARRRLAGVLLAAAMLPLLTYVLTVFRPHLNLADDLLVYLVVVVAVTVLGGFWPAVLAAVAASLLLNWYFTEPIHTFTIQQPRELLALLLFVTVAVAVSSVVHLAARRAVQAARAREEAASLLELAQTVLGGADSPAAVLEHLTRTHGGQAELQERVAGRWVRAASSGVEGSLPAASRIGIRPDLILLVTGQSDSATPALLAGYAAQAAAALDRERLQGSGVQAAHVQQVADQGVEPVGVLLDRGEQVGLVGLGPLHVGLPQAAHAGLDRGERRAQVVADSREQRRPHPVAFGQRLGLGGLGPQSFPVQGGGRLGRVTGQQRGRGRVRLPGDQQDQIAPDVNAGRRGQAALHAARRGPHPPARHPLLQLGLAAVGPGQVLEHGRGRVGAAQQIGRASCRERVFITV